MIHESTYTVRADEVWLDDRTRVARSRGFIMVDDGGSALYGYDGRFNLADHTGSLERPVAGHGDWRVHAGEAELSRVKTGRRIDYWMADFTSCDYQPPHYHFHSHHLLVYPGRSFWGFNNVFYIGKYPLLYSPLLYKSLEPAGKNALNLKMQPGYDKRNGAFVKATQTHAWTPTTYSKLFLDWYSQQGLGEGTELEHHDGGNRAMLMGYHVRENVTHDERWSGLGDLSQTFGSSVTVQGRLQEQSDPNFNNDYNRSNTFMVTPELVNNGAVVYHTAKYTARVAYNSIQDAYLPGTSTLAPGVLPFGQTKYLQTTEDAPSVQFQTAPLQFHKVPWLNTFNANTDSNYTIGRDYIQQTVAGGWQATRSIALAPGVTMTPLATYTETVYNRFDELSNSTGPVGGVAQTYLDAAVGRYTAQDTVRFDTLAGALDVGYAYTRRLAPGTFSNDAGASDHGIEQSLATVEDAFRPTRKIFVRATTGYDFRTFTYQTLQAKDRIQPITGEVYYTPRSSLTLSLRDNYQVDMGNQSMLADATWGDPLGTFAEASAGYNLGEADQYISSVLVGYEPSTFTWRVTAALRSVVATPGAPQQLSRFQLFDKELTFTKRWHDFYGQALVMLRPGGVKEYSARVQLRLPSEKETAVEHRDWESEWFPERKNGTSDRP